MTYNANIPQPGDLLSTSQGDILTNFTAADASFGVDHYAFSNQTANNGFHNTVTTPLIVGGAHPTTSASVPKFYAMNETTTNLGVLQYSRGGSDAVPTPVTSLHSTSAGITLLMGGGSTNVFDFTNVSVALCVFEACGTLPSATLNLYCAAIAKQGGIYKITSMASSLGAGVNVAMTGDILTITNSNGFFNLTNLYWTLKFMRVQV